MDLIYADNQLNDIDILQSYALDLAFGKDENDFALEMRLEDHCIEPGYYIYIEGTEYGGIVDRITVDSENGTVLYEGRTWHGIMASTIIEPPTGQGYYVANGDANTVVGDLIRYCGLDGLFSSLDELSGIQISNYQIRYSDLYSSLIDMLNEVEAKLVVAFSGSVVVLSVVKAVNYATNEEWDSSQRDFVATDVHRTVNHLICLGQGELANRYVIHLFADENGGIQPYNVYTDQSKIVDDSSYILDKSNQVLKDTDELTEVFDYSSAEFTDNYVLLSSQPKDWASKFSRYFMKDNNSWKNPEAVEVVEEPSPLSSQPSDWNTAYSRYYTKSGSSYYSVEGVEDTSVQEITNIPTDWNNNYENYYYWKTDGTTGSWTKISGVDVKEYVLQTQKPSDWNSSWKNYYEYAAHYASHIQDGDLVIVKSDTMVSNIRTEYDMFIQHMDNYWVLGNGFIRATNYFKDHTPGYSEFYFMIVNRTLAKNRIPQFVSNIYYGKNGNDYYLLTSKPTDWDMWGSYYVLSFYQYDKLDTEFPPTWKPHTYYTYKTTKKVAPQWGIYDKYGQNVTTVSAPTFKANTYYKDIKTLTYEVPPTFKKNTYYELKVDHYKVLVEKGIEKLKQYANPDSINMNLADDMYTYDIGDIVGATDNTTGLSVTQFVSKKIVTIDYTGTNISYEIGY